MNKILLYIIETGISLLLLYAVYWLFLRKETHFKLNRIYLLFSIAFSFLIPLLSFNYTSGVSQENDVVFNIIDKGDIYEEYIAYAEPIDIITPIEEPEEAIMQAETIASPNLEVENIANKESSISYVFIILMIMASGSAFFLIRFIYNIIYLQRLAKRNETIEIDGRKVIVVKNSVSSFSFLNKMFIGDNEKQENELQEILAHEHVHVKQYHSIDVLLCELAIIFQWFNPIAWQFSKALKNTHEFLADNAVIEKVSSKDQYHLTLLNQMMTEKNFTLTSNFSLNINKRVKMMSRLKSKRISRIKIAYSLPIILVVVLVFACNSRPKIYTGYYDNGNKRIEVTYKDGMLNGPYSKWYESGELKWQGQYVDSLPDGEFKTLKKDGSFYYIENYKNGILDGECKTWYLNGKMKSLKNYKDSVVNGDYKSWNLDGSLKEEGYYENSLPVGKQYAYYKNGNIETIIDYVKDKTLIPIKYFSSDGNCLWEGFLNKENKKQDSSWVYKHETGEICFEGIFREGVLYEKSSNEPYSGEVVVRFDNNDTCLIFSTYNGIYYGASKRWSKSGQLKHYRYYKNGHETYQILRNEDGHKEEVYYLYGEKRDFSKDKKPYKGSHEQSFIEAEALRKEIEGKEENDE